MIHLADIGYKAGDKWLLQEINCTVTTGEFVVVMGMNGAGKSTLLKLMSGIIKPATGSVHYGERSLQQFSAEELALQRAVLSQQHQLSFNLSIEEVVAMGRYPYRDHLSAKFNQAMITESMQRMDITHLAQRNYHTLSGGEAQKVQMSRVLSQIGHSNAENPKLLLLDEPVSHLDVKYQHQLLRVARGLTTHAVTVIAVLHDINLATVYADRIIFLKEGRLLYDITPAAVTSTIIDTVFDTRSHLLPDPLHDRPIVVFY